MGFLKKLASAGRKVLGGVVNAGNFLRTMRDKGLRKFNEIKDNLPGFVKAPLDMGLEFVMNSPVGRVAKTASGFLDSGVSAAEAALKRLNDYESSSGMPAAAQLQAIGERANEQASGGSPGNDDDQQAARLASLQQE